MKTSDFEAVESVIQLGDAYLILYSQIIPILSESMELGRHIENDVVIGSENVSRRHCQIRFEFGQYVLYDKNSTSGTFVNNKRINRCVLNSGDLISLADVKVMFIDHGAKLRDMTRVTTKRFDETSD